MAGSVSRYRVEKDQWRPDGLDCTHPYCDRFHANGCPEPGLRTEWFILDTVTGERAEFDQAETYDLKRDATAALRRHLQRLEAGVA